MYVAVHKVGNQWFRTDDGALVGTEVSNLDSFYRFHNIIIKTEEGRYLQTFMGYIDNKNQFVPMCRGSCMAQHCKMHNSEICLYAHKIEPTRSMYVVLPD